MLAERVREWTRPWVEQGIEQGRKEGVREGESGFLARLLEQKFGELPKSVRQRIGTADEEQLLLWGSRVLTAETLTKVFEDD